MPPKRTFLLSIQEVLLWIYPDNQNSGHTFSERLLFSVTVHYPIEKMYTCQLPYCIRNLKMFKTKPMMSLFLSVD